MQDRNDEPRLQHATLHHSGKDGGGGQVNRRATVTASNSLYERPAPIKPTPRRPQSPIVPPQANIFRGAPMTLSGSSIRCAAASRAVTTEAPHKRESRRGRIPKEPLTLYEGGPVTLCSQPKSSPFWINLVGTWLA